MPTEPFKFNPIFHNEPILYVQQKWQRPLDEHERHLAAEIYDWCRTNIEAEEVKVVEDLRKER